MPGIRPARVMAVARDNGSGRVVTTELSAAKIAAAKENFTETGLDDLITVLGGDALTTWRTSTDPWISCCSTAGKPSTSPSRSCLSHV